MRRIVQRLGYVPKIFLRCRPTGFGKADDIKRARITLQSFLAIVGKVFVKIREGKFTRGAEYRLPVAQDGVICLADCAPETSAAEQRYHMVIIVVNGLQVQKKRSFSVEPKRRRYK